MTWGIYDFCFPICWATVFGRFLVRIVLLGWSYGVAPYSEGSYPGVTVGTIGTTELLVGITSDDCFGFCGVIWVHVDIMFRC